jgi:hypothetical protein
MYLTSCEIVTIPTCNPPVSIVESRLYWMSAVVLIVLPLVLPLVSMVW